MAGPYAPMVSGSYAPMMTADSYLPEVAAGLYGPPTVAGGHTPLPDCSDCGYGGVHQHHAPLWMPDSHAYCGDYRLCFADRWYVQADALWLKRSKSANHNLTFERSSQAFILDTDDLKFDLQAGTRLTIGEYISDRTAVEFTFFGFHDWNAHAATPNLGDQSLSAYWDPSPGGGDGPFAANSFRSSAFQSASYSSRAYSWELGLRRWVSPVGSVLVGFRYANVDEEFSLDVLRRNGSSDTGSYRIKTDNDLVGLQIGGEYMRLAPADRVKIALMGKAGLYINFHEQESRLFDARAPAIDDTRSNSSTGLASIFEFGIIATYKLSEHIMLRGGYQHIFFTGLALAPDQLDSNPTLRNSRLSVSDTSSLHLQGPFIGGEFLFD